MNSSKKIVSIRGQEIGGEQPAICTPLIGNHLDQILAEVKHIIPKEPDIIEWRADFFKDLSDTQKVMDAAAKIREVIGHTAFLLTIRSEREGGQPISLTEKEKVQLLAEICKSKIVDLIDYELLYEAEDLQDLRQVSKEYGVYMIMSYHNFQSTPDRTTIVQTLLKMESNGADIAKVAVMPTSMEDVLVLLNATYDAHKQLKIPVITMSMGGYGAITRMIGGVFGSSVTFAVGQNSSAPGQIPVEDLRTVLQIVQKSKGE